MGWKEILKAVVNKEEEFTAREIAEETGDSVHLVHGIMKKANLRGQVKKRRIHKKGREGYHGPLILYTFTSKNPKIRHDLKHYLYEVLENESEK